MTGRALVYGATGYSGRLVAERMRDAGIDVVLAGRDAAKVGRLAAALALPCRTFGLRAGEPIDDALSDIAVVIHAAGPFQQTAAPMMAACIRTGTHYLDLAGEWPVFVDAMDRSMAASVAGVMLMPGVGFSIVASDCLLALAAARVPEPALLRLAVSQPRLMLRGTARSALGLASPTVLVRRAGALRAEPSGRLSHAFDFGEGLRDATALTFPDVITGQFTTGVADIETYLEADWAVRLTHRIGSISAHLAPEAAGRAISRLSTFAWPDDASDATRQRSGIVLVAECEDRWRRATTLRLHALDGYTVTAITATEIARRVLNGEHAPGFCTPARLFGGDFILGLGCARLGALAT
jgi:saccharopine dehydrogenase (NAD+, L-lysine-forming)